MSSLAVSAVCSVCGDRATKLRYSHYKVTSCFSCRAFFRRAVEKEAQRTYECVNKRQCPVTVDTRKKCPECRYRKCVLVGMTHAPPKTRRLVASHQGRDDAANEKDERSVFPRELLFGHGTTTVFTAEDEFRMNELSRLDRQHSLQLGEVLQHVPLAATLNSFLAAARRRATLEFGAICWAYTVGIRKLTRLAQTLDDFVNLTHVEDKKALLLHNLDPMFNIRMGRFFTCDADNFLEQAEKLAVFDFSGLKSASKWLPHIEPMRWHQFFSTPWANSEQHERKYESLMEQMKLLQLNRNTAILLTVLILFSTDCNRENQQECPDFRDKETITEMQRKYAGLLFRYLCHTRGTHEAEKSFKLFIKMSSNLREMSDIMKNKTIKMSSDSWPQVSELI